VYTKARPTRLVELHNSIDTLFFQGDIYSKLYLQVRLTILRAAEDKTPDTSKLASGETASRKDQEDENFDY
jgi:hypothetical protein